MKAKKSPLVLHNFFLLNQKYQFIQPADPPDIIKFMDQYSIDIDYAFKPIKNGFFQLFTKIDVNNIDKPLPGYKLFIEGVCIFSFDENKAIPENKKNLLLHISGINIGINSLRNIIAVITANGPFGKYTLPAIDVNQLLEDKKRITEKKGK
jgi:preprotein translocase subunit SecB